MINRLKLVVGLGTAVILSIIALATVHVVQRTERIAWQTARQSMEGSAKAVENALDRQLLQVDGALASLPALFRAAKIAPGQAGPAGELLNGISFQTMAFRDLMLIAPDGSVNASAQSRAARHPLPTDVALVGRNPTTLIGPLRNPITGDWSLYVARPVAGWVGIVPVAEVPLQTLMKLISETNLGRGVNIFLERAGGEVIASLPHDELLIGKPHRQPAHHDAQANGVAFMATEIGASEAVLAVARQSLYGDIRVVLTAKNSVLLADWRSARDRIVLGAVIVALFILAFVAAILVAIRQREKAGAERDRAAAVLDNAIAAMSDGFVMWDEDDRLVTCNQRFRDLYALSAPFIHVGMRFEDIVRGGAERGQYPQIAGDTNAFIEDLVAWRQQDSGTIERLLPGGRWVLVSERRTADGGRVGIRTDITALKTAHAELAAANARANTAAEEAHRQNAVLTKQESRIRFLAHHDDLTGLQNRLAFRMQIADTLQQIATDGRQIALLFLDLDRFKDINDTLGHPVGDQLLRDVAKRLSACARKTDSVARLGGDEFAILCTDHDQPRAAKVLSARIVDALSRPFSIQGRLISISTSIGIAVAEGAGRDADTLLKQADLALYQSKSRGRGTFCVFTEEMDEQLHDRIALEADLRRAIAEQQFELAYQPVYQLESRQLCGFEALLRWHHPERGAVAPGSFIPLAEETRLIVEIGAWVLRQACRDAVQLPGTPRIAVNLSPVQLAFGDTVAIVQNALDETGLDPARLELEITETALFDDDNRILTALKSLKTLGVRIVLDDFGTGYSSLSHLRLAPLDKVKIDRSFVNDMTIHPESAAIVSAIAALASELGMTTTAEGIETAAQLEAVRHAGCTEAQGYLLGKPAPLLKAALSGPLKMVPSLGNSELDIEMAG